MRMPLSWLRNMLKSHSQTFIFLLYVFAGGAEVMLLVVTDKDDLRLPDRGVLSLFKHKTCLKYSHERKRFKPDDDTNKRSVFLVGQFLCVFGFVFLQQKSESRHSLMSLESLKTKQVSGMFCSRK